jgi:hypothetical protein
MTRAPIWDAFWRAVACCWHPRVLLWALLPLLLAGGLVFVLGWAFWESAVAGVSTALQQSELLAALLRWLDSLGGGAVQALLAPMIVVALALPLVVLLTLLLVALAMTPAIVSLVAQRRFAGLERKGGAGWWLQLAWSLSCTAMAAVALVISLPLWFVPPLVLLLPPLIWGWLTARVMSFDVLASHASAPERRWLMHRHRWALLWMGLCCGAFGALPSLLWTFGVGMLPLAPLLGVASVWLYTVIFAFAACWFAHYLLAALAAHRAPQTAVLNAAAIAPGTP